MTINRSYNLWGVLFFGVIAVIGGFLLLHSIYYSIRSNGWQQTKATVIGIENHPKSAELRYTYNVEGREFTGDTFAFISEGTLFDKRLINDRYSVGDQIEVYVNPSNPNQSVVEQRSLYFTYIWKNLLIVGFSGFGAVQFWRESHKKT